MNSENPAKPIQGLDDLLQVFQDAEKPPSAWRVGLESEKFGIDRTTRRPIHYDQGTCSIKRMFTELAERYGWMPESEYPGGEIISLVRDQAHITLEPGGQLELSGTPFRTIHEIRDELFKHFEELHNLSATCDVTWLGLGFHPFAERSDFSWVPKLRYSVMKEYLPTRGTMGLDMMLRTCTVQANVDYSNEADAMRKMRLCLKTQPIATAMFANSPWKEGASTGERTHRAHVWLDVDSDRCGLLPFLWDDNASYRRYVERALDVPMFCIKRNGEVINNAGQTFGSFMNEGYRGHSATRADWDAHLRSLFPEVRIKETIEVRGADSQGAELHCALPALWKGLLYEPKAMSDAEKLVANLSYADAESVRPHIIVKALHAHLAGKELREWALELITIAEQGLQTLHHTNAAREDESVYLKPLKDLVAKGLSPADALLESIDPAKDLYPQVLELAKL